MGTSKDQGGEQIKLSEKIYERACNEQLFHVVLERGLEGAWRWETAGGGISIRSGGQLQPETDGNRVGRPWNDRRLILIGTNHRSWDAVVYLTE